MGQFEERVRKIQNWPYLEDRLEFAAEIINRGREPYFFFSDNGEKMISPVYEGGEKRIEDPIGSMLKYLIPQHMDKFRSILEDYSKGAGYLGEVEVALRSIRALAHFHPDRCIEPSMNDLGIINFFYEAWGFGERPLHLIGRRGHIMDILVIDQIRKFDAAKAIQIPENVERNLLSTSLPNYLQSDAECLEEFIIESSDLDNQSFFSGLKKCSGQLRCQEAIESFRKIFSTDFTVLPEYVESVAKTLRETGMYDVGLICKVWKA